VEGVRLDLKAVEARVETLIAEDIFNRLLMKRRVADERGIEEGRECERMKKRKKLEDEGLQKRRVTSRAQETGLCKKKLLGRGLILWMGHTGTGCSIYLVGSDDLPLVFLSFTLHPPAAATVTASYLAPT